MSFATLALWTYLTSCVDRAVSARMRVFANDASGRERTASARCRNCQRRQCAIALLAGPQYERYDFVFNVFIISH